MSDEFLTPAESRPYPSPTATPWEDLSCKSLNHVNPDSDSFHCEAQGVILSGTSAASAVEESHPKHKGRSFDCAQDDSLYGGLLRAFRSRNDEQITKQFIVQTTKPTNIF
jgi:hypothetical protein